MTGKIKGFKKFSEMNSGNKVVDDEEGVDFIIPEKRPALPNLPNDSTKNLKKHSLEEITPQNSSEEEEDNTEEIKEEVQFIGKVAKFPKKTKASKALNFLENVKISKNSIWYILIEKQDNELQMLKYNNKQGFDLSKFVLELKGFYIKKWHKEDPKLAKLVESIHVQGADEFSTIRNIPNIEIEPGKKLISKITEDLIKLLGK